MKKLTIAALVGMLALTGCASQQLVDEKPMVVDGELKKVKVVNIPSFQVEIAPRKAICEMMDTAGNAVSTECLQYRQITQKNFNTMNGMIQGFAYEPGYRYMLDLRQEAVADPTDNVVKPVWILNEVLSKTPEPTIIQ